MKKKERHIDKFIRDPLPEPEVPANDAWAGMNDMLNTTSGGNPINGHPGKWFSGLLKFKGLILTSLVLVSVSGIIIYKIVNSPASTLAPVPDLTQSEPPKNQEETIPGKAIPGKTQQYKTPPNVSKPEAIVIPDRNQKNPQPDNSVPTKNQEDSNQITTGKTLPNPVAAPIRARREPDVTESQGIAESLTTRSERVSGKKDENIARTKYRSQNPSSVPEIQKNESSGFAPGARSLKAEPASSSNRQYNIASLKPLNVHFGTFNPELGKRVIVQNFPKQSERKNSTQRTFHVGLEWSLNSSLKSTEYIATGADSIPRVARLLIPGIFVTKNWQKSSITVSYLPYQSYFGNNKLVRQEPDSLNTDSVQIFSNTLFIKAVGMTFSAQYQYHVTGLFALNAGASYNIFTSALVRPQVQTWQGQLLDEQLTTLKKSKEMSPYINPRLFTLKAGIALTPGRFQAGLNVILPLSNISKSPQFPVKTLNGQFYLRYLVW